MSLIRGKAEFLRKIIGKSFEGRLNLSRNMSGVQLNEVIEKLTSKASLDWAENWDNVGVLIEPSINPTIKKVLLTIDLTEDVLEEAVAQGTNLIVSYHPNIFKPMKRLNQSAWKDRIVIKCLQNNITVFSPHTSWDAMDQGVNDWLGSFLPKTTSKVLEPNPKEPSIGMGRLLTLQEPLKLKVLIEACKKHVGLPYLRIAFGRGKSLDTLIQTVALCAGSGAGVLTGTPADLYLTGEMSHHEVLDATQNGISVICCNHSDSERGFLPIMAQFLRSNSLEVSVSQKDKDVFCTI